MMVDRDCPPFKILVLELHFDPIPASQGRTHSTEFASKRFTHVPTLKEVQAVEVEQLKKLREHGFVPYSRRENWRYVP
jgi:hypothetical protein